MFAVVKGLMSDTKSMGSRITKCVICCPSRLHPRINVGKKSFANKQVYDKLSSCSNEFGNIFVRE